MEFSIVELLANFTDDKLVAPKVLEKKLGCDDETSFQKLQIALDALAKVGVLEKDRGRYRRIFEENMVEGKLRCSSKGFCFAIQDEEEADDIYIRESHLSSAWNGDRVLVKVTKEGSRRRSPEGEVRVILERANATVLARVKQDPPDIYRATPLDDRLLFELDLIQNGISLAEAVDQLVHVEILRYPLGQASPIGRITQVLGTDAQSAADTDIVCCKYDLPRVFPSAVLEAAEELSNDWSEEDLSDRIDLRELLTIAFRVVDIPAPFTPNGKKPARSKADLLEISDDAITLEQFEDGQWRLGIHIADISPYIPVGSALDLEAQKRGTSVYLGDMVLPMLPERFSQICSLVPDDERLAISVLLILNDEGEVLEFEIQPTIVQVDHSLNYQDVQAVLLQSDVVAEFSPELAQAGTGASETSETIDDPEVVAMLENLFRLSQALKEQRRQRGSFELNLPDTRFHYDDEGAFGAMVISSSLFARTMILEFMVLVNQLVASHLKALGLPGIYRIHQTPNFGEVQEFMKLASNMGIELELAQEDIIQPVDYQHFTQQFALSKAEKVMTYLLQETLKPASYATAPRPHFGLALEEGYTHFTAPMRRYPDLLVHRALHALFEHGRDRKSTRSREVVELRHSSCHDRISWNVLPSEVHQELEEQFANVVAHLSDCEKVALEAEEDLEGLKKSGFMKEHTGGIFQGLITGVQSYGFFVEIEDLLVEGLVHVSSLKDDWYEYRSRQQKLVGRKNRKQYRLGDRVEVQVKGVDYYRQQIDLVAIGGGSQASEDDLDLEDGPTDPDD